MPLTIQQLKDLFPIGEIVTKEAIDALIENMRLIGQKIPAIDIYGLPSFTCDTYAQMLTKATGDFPLTLLVLHDEKKGQENTVYNYFPNPTGDPVLMWVAAIKETI